MNRFRFVVTCAAVAASLVSLGGGVAQAAAADPPAGGMPGVGVPTLTWTDCGGGYQCTPARVPLDYHHPAGTQLTLQVRRWRAADPGDRIGTLFVAAGGPGDSGWDRVQEFAASSAQEIRDRFDIVGLDPRGVGRSQAVTCLDGPAYRDQWAQVSTRRVPGDATRAIRLARDFNAACRANSGDLLPYLGAEFQARDLDLLRAAVGDEKLTYVGESYAAYVGTVYANLFPERTRALVLDAGYDPDAYANHAYEDDHARHESTEKALYRFLDWCADTPDECAFASGEPPASGVDLRAKVRAVLEAFDADPVPDALGAVGANGATVLSEVTSRLNDGVRGWARLGTDLHLAEARTGPLLSATDDADAVSTAANVAVQCADRVYPRSLHDLKTQFTSVADDFPLTGPGLAFGPPAPDGMRASSCVQWSADRRSRFVGPYRAAGSAPILVVGTTGDPAVPYADSVALAKTLANGHLLTWQGEGHAARGRSACAERHMDDYLVKLDVPKDGTVCRDAPIPG